MSLKKLLIIKILGAIIAPWAVGFSGFGIYRLLCQLGVPKGEGAATLAGLVLMATFGLSAGAILDYNQRSLNR